MTDQSRPVEPADANSPEDAAEKTGAGKTAAEETPEVPGAGPHSKSRPSYLDPRGSESTREMRDTARRRRDAEEKLQQHLLEAKDHVPNEHHEQQGRPED